MFLQLYFILKKLYINAMLISDWRSCLTPQRRNETLKKKILRT